VNTEHWWNDKDKRKPKYPEVQLSRCYFVHQQPHINFPAIDPRLQKLEIKVTKYFQKTKPIMAPSILLVCKSHTDLLLSLSRGDNFSLR
jgi:hypothetical protein